MVLAKEVATATRILSNTADLLSVTPPSAAARRAPPLPPRPPRKPPLPPPGQPKGRGTPNVPRGARTGVFSELIAVLPAAAPPVPAVARRRGRHRAAPPPPPPPPPPPERVVAPKRTPWVPLRLDARNLFPALGMEQSPISGASHRGTKLVRRMHMSATDVALTLTHFREAGLRHPALAQRLEQVLPHAKLTEKPALLVLLLRGFAELRGTQGTLAMLTRHLLRTWEGAAASVSASAAGEEGGHRSPAQMLHGGGGATAAAQVAEIPTALWLLLQSEGLGSEAARQLVQRLPGALRSAALLSDADRVRVLCVLAKGAEAAAAAAQLAAGAEVATAAAAAAAAGAWEADAAAARFLLDGLAVDALPADARPLLLWAAAKIVAASPERRSGDEGGAALRACVAEVFGVEGFVAADAALPLRSAERVVWAYVVLRRRGVLSGDGELVIPRSTRAALRASFERGLLGTAQQPAAPAPPSPSRAESLLHTLAALPAEEASVVPLETLPGLLQAYLPAEGGTDDEAAGAAGDDAVVRVACSVAQVVRQAEAEAEATPQTHVALPTLLSGCFRLLDARAAAERLDVDAEHGVALLWTLFVGGGGGGGGGAAERWALRQASSMWVQDVSLDSVRTLLWAVQGLGVGARAARLYTRAERRLTPSSGVLSRRDSTLLLWCCARAKVQPGDALRAAATATPSNAGVLSAAECVRLVWAQSRLQLADKGVFAEIRDRVAQLERAGDASLTRSQTMLLQREFEQAGVEV